MENLVFMGEVFGVLDVLFHFGFEVEFGLFLVDFENEFLLLVNVLFEHVFILPMNAIADGQLIETAHNGLLTALKGYHQVVKRECVILLKVLL